MQNFTFNWQFKDFEIRTYQDESNSNINDKIPLELVKYNDSEHTSCFTVAWFVYTDEGYELHFVGDRPFKHISSEEISDIWEQLRTAQLVLDGLFKTLQ